MQEIYIPLGKNSFIDMSLKNACKAYNLMNLLLVLFVIMIFLCTDLSSAHEFRASDDSSSTPAIRLTKRSYSGRRCANHAECSSEVLGSVCVRETCVCPQGYLPDGCFHVGSGQLGRPCNSSCGEELPCINNVCGCPEGFQLLRAQGTSLCLLWHKPTRLVDRCRSNEDCKHNDANSVCKKRWCQCGAGHQLFETVLFGRRHKCFETSTLQCNNFAQCSQLAVTLDQHCTCLYGFCHCIADANFTSLEIITSSNPNWYQRWKKDIVLATRLLFVTVVLFFVPCFIYVTLGMRERSRHLFSQLVQQQQPAAVHYHRQRRTSPCPSRPAILPASTEEDPPPSYEETVRKEEAPPPYGAL